MKKIIVFVLVALSFSCAKNSEVVKKEYHKTTLQEKIKSLHNADGKDILIAVHRAGWRYAPENSLQAIQNCIDMGVDIVEIDVCKTKDGKLVLMHDEKIDRTTTGKGFVSDWTLDSLKTLDLRTGANTPTTHKIPTLKDAMLLAKGKILVNLDKSYKIFDEVYQVLEETGTTNIVIMKGGVPLDKLKKEFGKYLDKVPFMPIIHLDRPNAQKMIDEYQTNFHPVGFEFVFKDETSPIINQFKEIRKKGSRVWVNSLWASLDAGYDDDAAYKNRDSIYGWYIKKGVNMIQTDRPKLLLEYLRSKDLHD